MIRLEAWYREADEQELARLERDVLRGDEQALHRYWDLMERLGFPASRVTPEILAATPRNMWVRIPLLLVAKNRRQVPWIKGEWDGFVQRDPSEIAALPPDLQPQVMELVMWVDPEHYAGRLDNVKEIDYTLPAANPWGGGGEIPYASEDILSEENSPLDLDLIRQHGKRRPFVDVLSDIQWALGPGSYQVSERPEEGIVSLYTVAGYDAWFYYWYLIEMPQFMQERLGLQRP